MFGYIRPLRSELRVREFELYRAVYCGLCHAIGSAYGTIARNVLSYDFAFLAMVLWTPGDKPVVRAKRCFVSPVKGKSCVIENNALTRCAGFNVILAREKLLDDIRDENTLKSIPPRAAAIALLRAGRGAQTAHPQYGGRVKSLLSELSEIEKEFVNSLDAPADKFANILAACAGEEPDDNRRRALSQLLYHVGRWIYILDAVQDQSEDKKSGNYNPILLRGGADDAVKQTLIHSQTQAAAAFELLEECVFSDISRNILYLGMSSVMDAVFEGSWTNNMIKKEKHIR